MRELVMDKLKGWDLRARKYGEKIKSGNTDNLVRECWEEKQSYDWNDIIYNKIWRERVIITGTDGELNLGK